MCVGNHPGSIRRRWGSRWLLLAVLCLGPVGPVGRLRAQEPQFDKSVVMIQCISQEYNYSTPWQEHAMSRTGGTGFIIAGRRILTNAHNVSNARYVELRKQNSAQRYPARIAHVAHDCDLALLTVADEGFFADMEPLELGGIPPVNSTVSTFGFPVGGQRISVTEGIVSRVEVDLYSHTGADAHLVVQTDAAINPGNSGGPVIQAGKVVGVAFQGLRQADNIGYMIPTSVIQHFLTDIEDGRYDQYGSLGFAFYEGLHSPAYRTYLQVPEGEQGIVVLRTLLNSSAEKVLQPGDVITHFDEFAIDNDGMIQIYGLRLDMTELIEQKQIGDAVRVTFYRDGQRRQETLQVALNRPVLDYSLQFDRPPPYVVLAGLTFTPVSRNFLQTWGGSWPTEIPAILRYLFVHSSELNEDPERREYVVLSEILPDEINTYADDFKNLPLESINGRTIRALADVLTAWETPQDGFHALRFLGKQTPLILNADQARQRQDLILKQYQVPSDRRLEE
ncbi:MAG: trypsin-like peptidase domain-containing protein [Sedimentisphaerales bacterium]|nr:trypsin-like peptidase domain-containing protein [Sedimentisphaerales bacterium]